MLYFYFFTFDFFRFCQSGCYFDFFFKKCSEVFVRNIFIYAAQFFGEKYMIEVFTKKIFHNVVKFQNKILNFSVFSYSIYFIQILSVFFYMLSLVNFFYF